MPEQPLRTESLSRILLDPDGPSPTERYAGQLPCTHPIVRAQPPSSLATAQSQPRPLRLVQISRTAPKSPSLCDKNDLRVGQPQRKDPKPGGGSRPISSPIPRQEKGRESQHSNQEVSNHTPRIGENSSSAAEVSSKQSCSQSSRPVVAGAHTHGHILSHGANKAMSGLLLGKLRYGLLIRCTG
jgi:hypothetical protein